MRVILAKFRGLASLGVSQSGADAGVRFLQGCGLLVGERETGARLGRTVASFGKNLEDRLKTRGELADKSRKPAAESAIEGVAAGSHGTGRGHNENLRFSS